MAEIVKFPNPKEHWRRWFNQVWKRIEKERGYPCEKTFDDFCDDLDAGQPEAIVFLGMLHLERCEYQITMRGLV